MATGRQPRRINKRIVDKEHLVVEDFQRLLWYINMLLFDLTDDLMFSHNLGCIDCRTW
jgi:hypothetical protein